MQSVSEGGTVTMAGKFNMTPTKVPMPERDPKERAKCFEEVAMGYTPEQAQEEATRCLHCKAKDRKSTRLNSSHRCTSRMPSSA